MRRGCTTDRETGIKFPFLLSFAKRARAHVRNYDFAFFRRDATTTIRFLDARARGPTSNLVTVDLPRYLRVRCRFFLETARAGTRGERTVECSTNFLRFWIRSTRKSNLKLFLRYHLCTLSLFFRTREDTFVILLSVASDRVLFPRVLGFLDPFARIMQRSLRSSRKRPTVDPLLVTDHRCLERTQT